MEFYLESTIYIWVVQRKLFLLPLSTTTLFRVHTALRPITHKHKLHTQSEEILRPHNILIRFITVSNSYKKYVTFAEVLLTVVIISFTSTFELREQLSLTLINSSSSFINTVYLPGTLYYAENVVYYAGSSSLEYVKRSVLFCL